MFIKCIEDLTREDVKNNIYMPRISLSAEGLSDMMYKATGQEEQIVCILNKIKSQGIEDIDLMKCTYRVNGNKVSIRYLSTAERLFFVASLADITRTSIIVQGEIGGLSERVLDLFFKEFSASEFVNILCIESFDVSYYKKLRDKYL